MQFRDMKNLKVLESAMRGSSTTKKLLGSAIAYTIFMVWRGLALAARECYNAS
jgi:hypothetical protein